MRILLIDGLNLIRRVYAAVPGEPGTPTHDEDALLSITRSVGRAVGDAGATHAICVMDSPGPGWRHEILPQYKAARPSMPDALTRVLPEIAGALEALGVPSVAVPDYEADDVLAGIAHKLAARPALHVIVLSTDKSMLSLLPLGVTVRHHFEQRDLGPAFVYERYGVAPEQLLDWMALVGDAGQGVPGAKGVGQKSASALLSRYADLDAIFHADIDADRDNARALSAAQRDAGMVRLSRRLVTLRIDANAGINLQACRVKSTQ